MQPSSSQNKNIFTISKLNRLARRILESEIGQVWISAEISNFVAASSGHWYFSLKDDKAQIRAAMFKGANRRLTNRPKNGDKALVRASVSLYEPRGDYQLIVEHLEADGEGALKLAFEQLKIKLSAEGLFSQESKKTIPELIRKVGIVTSANGAALHDILTVLKRRSPATEVVIYPALVQGESAHLSIIQAIKTANLRNEVDLLLVGRGGGSLEDLWCFNHEQLARAIFDSKLPIVSAVGHEIDISITDFVADLRAATPSAAAELISMDQREWLDKLDVLQDRLNQACQIILSRKQSAQHSLGKHLALLHPQRLLEQQSQHLDSLKMQLNNGWRQKQYAVQTQLNQTLNRLIQHSPEHKVMQQLSYQQQLQQRLEKGINETLQKKQQVLAAQSHVLDTVSPLATLSRGYSISFKDKQIIRSAKAVTKGDKMLTHFADGDVISEVVSKS